MSKKLCCYIGVAPQKWLFLTNFRTIYLIKVEAALMLTMSDNHFNISIRTKIIPIKSSNFWPESIMFIRLSITLVNDAKLQCGTRRGTECKKRHCMPNCVVWPVKLWNYAIVHRVFVLYPPRARGHCSASKQAHWICTRIVDRRTTLWPTALKPERYQHWLDRSYIYNALLYIST